jgi:hypothetical protein
LRSLLAAVIMGLTVWLVPQSALAKSRKVEPAAPPAEKDYIMPYAVVVLGIALGVIVVSRPSNRANEPKLPVEGKEEGKK